MTLTEVYCVDGLFSESCIQRKEASAISSFFRMATHFTQYCNASSKEKNDEKKCLSSFR